MTGAEGIDMARRVTMVGKLPNAACRACHGMGAIRITVHFHSGDQEWEAPCWECFDSTKLALPKPSATQN